jgi:muconolactone delta-isomerase
MTTHLFLERTFDPPIDAAEVRAPSRVAWCLEMYRVHWQASFLAIGGDTLVCWFTGPDAESARVALAKSGIDTRRLWIGTVHDAPTPAKPTVLVERSFSAPVELADIQAAENAAARHLQAHPVKWAQTFFAADRQRMLSLYEAPDTESVRRTQHAAGLPTDAIWVFELILP